MFAVLRELRSNEAIRGISWGQIPFAPNIICLPYSYIGMDRTGYSWYDKPQVAI
jgi:hypothetical protein